jgi:hypothetical protein
MYRPDVLIHSVRPGAALLVGAALLALTGCGAPATTAEPTPRPSDDLITDVVPTETPTSAPIIKPDDTVGYTWVFDDTAHVAVSVPDAWTDVDGTGYVDTDGANWYRVSASPDLDAYYGGWETPGVDVTATAFAGPLTAEEADDGAADLFAALNDSFAFDDSCITDQVDVPYGDTDNWYKGYLSTWTDCAGTHTAALLMSMYDTKLTHFIFVASLLVTDQEQDEVAQEILASYQASFDDADKAYIPRG